MRVLLLLALVCLHGQASVRGETFSDAQLADLLEGSIRTQHPKADDTYFGDGLGINLSPGDAASAVDAAAKNMLEPGAAIGDDGGASTAPPNMVEFNNPAESSLLQPGAPLTRPTASADDGVQVLPAFAPQQNSEWVPAPVDTTGPSMDLGEHTSQDKATANPNSKISLTAALKAKHTLELAEQRLGLKAEDKDGGKGGSADGDDDEDPQDREDDAAEEAAVDKEDAVGKLAKEVKEEEDSENAPAPAMNINGNGAPANETAHAMQHLVTGEKTQEMENKVSELEGTVARVDNAIETLVSKMKKTGSSGTADDGDGAGDDDIDADADADDAATGKSAGDYDPNYKAPHLTPESQEMIKDATEESLKLSEKTHGMKEDGDGFRELTPQEKEEFMDDVQDYGKHSVGTLVGSGKILYRGGDMLFNNKNLTDAERAEFKKEVKDTAKNAAGAFLKGTIISAKSTSYLVGGLYNSINWLQENENADDDGANSQGGGEGADDSSDSDSDFANTPEEEHLTGGAEPSSEDGGAPDADGMDGSTAEPKASGDDSSDQDSDSADDSDAGDDSDGGQSKSTGDHHGQQPAATDDDNVDRDAP